MLKEKERRRHIRTCNCFGSIWNNSLNVNKVIQIVKLLCILHSPNNTDRSTLNPSKIYAMKGMPFDQLTEKFQKISMILLSI